MKRLVGLLAMVVLVAVSAQALEVTSENVVGFKQVVLQPDKLHLLAMGMYGMGGDTAMDVLGTDTIRAGNSPVFADRVYMWDNDAQEYVTFALNSSDNQYHSLTNFGGLPIMNPTMLPGDGFWVWTPGFGPYAGQTNEFAICGEVVEDAEIPLDVKGSGQFTLLGYPFSADIALNDTSFAADGATPSGSPAVADKLKVWDTDANNYIVYGLHSTGAWRQLFPVNEWAVGDTADVLPMNVGFWFEAANAFTWSETNTYVNNLH